MSDDKLWDIAFIWPPNKDEPVEWYCGVRLKWWEPALCFTDATGKDHIVSHTVQYSIREHTL